MSERETAAKLCLLKIQKRLKGMMDHERLVIILNLEWPRGFSAVREDHSKLDGIYLEKPSRVVGTYDNRFDADGMFEDCEELFKEFFPKKPFEFYTRTV